MIHDYEKNHAGDEHDELFDGPLNYHEIFDGPLSPVPTPKQPPRTHQQTAEWCLEPVTKGHSAQLIAEAQARVCTALADLRRQHLDAQAAMLSDGTPHAPKGPA